MEETLVTQTASDRSHLPELPLVEMYLLAQVILYGSVTSVIQLRAFYKDGGVRVLNGHIMSFLNLLAALNRWV